MPKLPADLRAAIFDMDGVLTDTASLHEQAWKATFDALLQSRDPGSPPFTQADYDAHVDGLPRADGVRAFLASRDITLPEGEADDPPDVVTVNGIGAAKNQRLLRIIQEQGVRTFPGSIRLVESLRSKGVRTAVASSSANTADVLRRAGIDGLFDARVDGVTIAERDMPGKPAPDMFLAAARDLGVAAAHAAVFEDALAGVQAGRAGHFGVVVGVDRADQAAALREHGADIVVSDLAELLES